MVARGVSNNGRTMRSNPVILPKTRAGGMKSGPTGFGWEGVMMTRRLAAPKREQNTTQTVFNVLKSLE